MKNILVTLFMLLFVVFGCSHIKEKADYIGGGILYGDNSRISAFGSHVRNREDIDVYGIHLEAGKINKKVRYGLETDISKHEYDSKDPKRDNKDFLAIDVEFFGTYDLVSKDTWQLYLGGGAGLGYALLFDSGYPLVGDSKILGVFDYRFGWRKEVKFGEISIEYKSKHWSDPLNKKGKETSEDVGENDDIIYLKFSILF
ncbi:MAG: hypothetical protein PVG65_00810 [Candidatus Thorarchaeota archaeon]|jgi:hypothetical protein